MGSNAIEDIRSIHGMEEFKALAARLAQVADNRRKLTGARIQLPNYLFAVAPGCGVTTRIRQLTRLLDDLHLIRFEGDRKYFEWVLDSAAFKENGGFDRLLDQIRLVAGFRNSFYGVIGLDIEAWVRNADSPDLSRLMDFAEDMLGQITIVFVVNLHDADALAPIARRISQAMPLEIIRIEMPNAEELVQCLTDFLRKRGFSVRTSAKEYFLSIMPELIRDEQFDGFQTLENLADEIVYRYCSGEINDSIYLDRSDVAFISAPDGYINRIRGGAGSKVRRQIGFDTGRNA